MLSNPWGAVTFARAKRTMPFPLKFSSNDSLNLMKGRKISSLIFAPDFHTDHLSGFEQRLSESFGAYRKAYADEAHHHHTTASVLLCVYGSSFSHGHGIFSS